MSDARDFSRFAAATSPMRIALIGAGGNGSECFDGLTRLHEALLALGAPGLDICVFDPDEVSASNIVRQRFWPHEIGLNKAIALVHRTNLLLGTDWQAIPECFASKPGSFDLIISAVDNVRTRQKIARSYRTAAVLWLDMGCDRAQGQVVLGLAGHTRIDDPLPCVVAHYPQLMEAVDDNRPSCSTAESLSRQDLMVNSAVAGAAVNLLWKCFRTGRIPYNGVVIDLDSGFSQAMPFIDQSANEAA